MFLPFNSCEVTITPYLGLGEGDGLGDGDGLGKTML